MPAFKVNASTLEHEASVSSLEGVKKIFGRLNSNFDIRASIFFCID